MSNQPNNSNNATDIANKKSCVRKKFMQVRDSLTNEYRARASENIARQFSATAEYRRAEIIFTYVSFKTEVDTHAIIEQMFADGKHVAVPRCTPHTRKMSWHEICSLADLQIGAYGILEPADDTQALVVPPVCDPHNPAPRSMALALIPGIAFDSRGHRLGYGGGYYDRFLQNFAGASIGLCFRECFVPALSCNEPHDIALDFVLQNNN